MVIFRDSFAELELEVPSIDEAARAFAFHFLSEGSFLSSEQFSCLVENEVHENFCRVLVPRFLSICGHDEDNFQHRVDVHYCNFSYP